MGVIKGKLKLPTILRNIMKTCNKCSITKPLDGFHRGTAAGHKKICKDCYKAPGKIYASRWYKKNKAKHALDTVANFNSCRKRLLPIKNKFLKGRVCSYALGVNIDWSLGSMENSSAFLYLGLWKGIKKI